MFVTKPENGRHFAEFVNYHKLYTSCRLSLKDRHNWLWAANEFLSIYEIRNGFNLYICVHSICFEEGVWKSRTIIVQKKDEDKRIEGFWLEMQCM